MKIRSISILLLAMLLVSGCEMAADIFSPSNECPNKIITQVAQGKGGILWGDAKSPRATASIGRIVIECIPDHVPTSKEVNKSKAGRLYEIAITADVNYTYDKKSSVRYLGSGVMFEALSSTGVVLGKTTEYFSFVEGDTSAKISSKIQNISSEEIKRIAIVEARWLYGQ